MTRPYTEPSQIVEFFASKIDWLTEDQKAAMLRAIASKGRKKGYLKAKSPSAFDDQMACAAWQGMQPNAYKLSISAVMMLRDPAAKEFATKLSEFRFPAWLDYDRHTLQSMGVW